VAVSRCHSKRVSSEPSLWNERTSSDFVSFTTERNRRRTLIIDGPTSRIENAKENNRSSSLFMSGWGGEGDYYSLVIIRSAGTHESKFPPVINARRLGRSRRTKSRLPCLISNSGHARVQYAAKTSRIMISRARHRNWVYTYRVIDRQRRIRRTEYEIVRCRPVYRHETVRIPRSTFRNYVRVFGFRPFSKLTNDEHFAGRVFSIRMRVQYPCRRVKNITRVLRTTVRTKGNMTGRKREFLYFERYTILLSRAPSVSTKFVFC